ncbi:DUF421 domain-containing protein [Peribacillus aracenensis]|uniref:DUF421 domain-containing protein n=1 Tax=Peribacillus aracenensis TaxID=2976708 RepID=UPI0021A30FED|nr:DUF421 domain-containing protein [Peribacillus sp. BBB004]
MQGFVEIIFRPFIAFILLWVFVHLLGKQTISQRTYHLYIASITMGTLAGNLAFNIKVNFLYPIIAIIIMGSIVFILNLVAVRNPRFGKWIAGEPVALIQKGKILEESMQRMGYSLDSLKQALRGKDIFNLEEVECAILEINGSISVLKKTQYQNTTKQDMALVSSAGTVPIEMVYDGKILYENLSKQTYDDEWLMAELKKRNLSVFDISYAVIGTKGNLYIDLIKDQSRES